MQKRSNGLDVLKLLCAFVVVCIHCTFSVREYIEPLTRAAVPVFFMITGFFYPEDAEKQKRQLIRIFKILIYSVLLYMLWNFGRTLVERGSIAALLGSWFTAKSLIKLLLFNAVPFTHLWYLSALLYVLVIVRVLGERGRKFLNCLIPFLFCGLLLLGAYSPLVFGEKLSPIYSRNFLFTGLPFFLLGGLLRQHEGKLRRVPALPLFLLSVILVTLEGFWLQNRTGYSDMDLYASTLLVAPSLFILACRESRALDSAAGKTLARWGQRYSLGVYIIHPIIIELIPLTLGGLFTSLPVLARLYYYTAPLLILLLSVAITALFKTRSLQK